MARPAETARSSQALEAGESGQAATRSVLPGTSGLLATYGLFFAEAALSGVRHDLLNRMTALGALSYELGRALSEVRNADPTGAPSVAQERLADLNRQIAATTVVAGRRLETPRRARESCEVGAVIEEVAHMGRWPTRIQTLGGDVPRARMAAVELAVALLCLIDNAVEATGRGRGPDVVVSRTRGPAGRLLVTVEDRGRGLEQPERTFERFFTTKPGHAGLGLCVTRRVAERWDGEITLAVRDGGGTRATLVLSTVGARGARRS